MNELKRKSLLAIFAISALLVSIPSTNLAFADDSSEKDDEREDKMEKERELKKEKMEKEREYKKEHKEKMEKTHEYKKELREEYHKKLEEKKKLLADYRKELKEKYHDLKKEFKEKYAQLRISQVSDTEIDGDDEVEEIKYNELRLLKHEFREKIKNLKLEAKQHFDELKHQFKEEQTDRKNKIHDRINELKEKYKNKIRQHDRADFSHLDSYPTDYANKKIEICHIPPGNPENAHTLIISVNSLRAHLAHGDYIGHCETDDETDIEPTSTGGDETNDANEEGKNITVELKEELGISQQ